MSEVTDPRDANGPQHATLRPLAWLAAGLLALVLVILAIAPELVDAPGQITGTLAVVLIAGVPGALLLAVAVRRRRGDGDDRGEA